MQNINEATLERSSENAQIPKPALDSNGSISINSEAGAKIYMDYLASKTTVTVIDRPVKGSTFRDVVIEGRRFRCTIGSNGPEIESVAAKWDFQNHGLAPLGNVIEIHYCPDAPPHIFRYPRRKGWCICKYGADEPLIWIDEMPEAARYTLAFQFGIPIFPHAESGSNYPLLPNGDSLFFLSPSFSRLSEWASSHPRRLNSKKIQEYFLPNWKKKALQKVGGEV